MKGTDNLIKKYNISIDKTRRQKKLVNELFKAVRSSKGLADDNLFIICNPQKNSEKFLNRVGEFLFKKKYTPEPLSGGARALSGFDIKGIKSTISQGDPLREVNIANRILKKIKGQPYSDYEKALLSVKKNKFDKKYLKEIIKRHEVDEVRYSKNIFNKYPKKYRDLGDAKETLTDIYSHASPKVIFSESTNVSTAPEKVRKAMIEARKMTGEYDFFDDYGRTGTFPKRISNMLENYIAKERRKKI